MRIKIFPGRASGTIRAPSSKSAAHRALICAGLSKGKSVISNVDFSQDILATIDCLNSIGAKTKIEDDKVYVIGYEEINKNLSLFCRESGSTLRFFIPICMIEENSASFFGKGRLMERPIGVYEKVFAEHGVSMEKDKNCLSVHGRLTGGKFKLDASVSSQFISGLLFALPTVEDDSKIILENKIESRPYIEMTIDILRKFGIEIQWNNEREIFIKGNQIYQNFDYYVEGDYSNAAFFFALGEDVKVEGLNENSLQADKVFCDYLNILKSERAEIDISNCPDLGPILFAEAAINKGAVFTGTRRLKIKESDRVECMKTELLKFGIKMEANENSVEVFKSEIRKPECVIESHNDHRIAMALSVLLTKTGGEIEGAECVEKSMPDFFEKLEKINVRLEKYET